MAITEMQVKSQVARPGPLETIPAGKPYLMRGAAWSCGSEIVSVEVTTDCGRTWGEARLGIETDRHAWRLWEFEWLVPNIPGRVTVQVRARDAKGRTQPEYRDRYRGGYMINEVLGIDVIVQ